ncbi:dethiobiotin synthase [Poritiphilus flavus]|uniref:ATP-dependent dethiobiotin synthetase BioD n=1 Tax=Poritiphilus flavus TaxID=2697053 RepID=A0A6L9ED40_9FLAO|nr:dethiobiotin synthase [Poritiphilus flavus]NAS12606.1 dethiobiotin synthase [Poritiphilus flavus]
MKRIFVTGISTEVGKTVASAIITEALEADYWKPIQAGDLDNSDSHKVARWISNSKTVIHPNSYALHTPMSPHAAADIDNILIDLKNITEPQTDNHLVIEGAGGLLVPLNDEDTILDLIRPEYKVVVVSRHYLGSINHSLLTIGWLERLGFEVNLLFSGDEHPSTESIIRKKTKARLIGRIDEEAAFNKQLVKEYAQRLLPALQSL